MLKSFRYKAFIGLVLSMALLGAGGPSWGASGSKVRAPITLSLLAMNDFHGNLLPGSSSVLVADPANPSGTRVPVGGAAYLASLVHQLKQQNPGNTMLLGVGDLIGASPLSSGLFHDEPTIEVLNQIGLEISSVGNHEFDKGASELLRMQRGGCFARTADASAGLVGQDTCMNQGRFKGAKFSYLAANVIDQKTDASLLPAYALRKLGGVTLGFIGLTLKDTPSVVTPAGVAGLKFDDEVASVNKLVPLLQAKGATVIVLLLHQGGQTEAKTALDKSCPGFSGEVLSLSDRMNPAVDLILTGHTHQDYVCHRPDGKLVTQAGSYGRMLTKVDLTIDGKTKKVMAKDANNHLVINDLGVKDAKGNLIPLPAGRVALRADPAVDRVLRRYDALSNSVANVVIGRLGAALDRKMTEAGESSLGDVIADAFLAGSSDTSYGPRAAQIAFTNRGGIRSDLTGNLTVTFGQLFSVMPFNNTLVSMDLSGRQLLRLLEQQWESPQPAEGRILSVSQGLTYTWDANQPAGAAPGNGQRVQPQTLKLHGETVDLDKSYRVTVNSFLASGGDNFTVLKEGKNLQEAEVDSIVVKQYFRATGVVNPPQLNRIARLAATAL
jgi:5'-nucleotidase